MVFEWTLLNNLLTPVSLLFFLGVGVGLVRSDFQFPQGMVFGLSVYLMVAIGLKGGAAFVENPLNPGAFMLIFMGVGMSALWPFFSFYLLRLTTHLSQKDAAAVSAHYGSVSVVTFITAASFCERYHIPYATSLVAVLSLMEAPAIFSGLFMAQKDHTKTFSRSMHKKLLREVFSSGPIVLLLGSFLIGSITGSAGFTKIKAFYGDPFQGVLSLFLLEMGLSVAHKFHEMKKITPALFAFGLYMPVVGACVGITLCWLMGFDQGTAFLFGILCASSSYIAVPACLKIALPEASPSLYMPLSLGVTFPFNIIAGIPFYFWITKMFYAFGC